MFFSYFQAPITPDQPSIITPAFTTLLKNAINPANLPILSTVRKELINADNAAKKQDNQKEFITIDPTNDNKNAIVQSQINIKTTEESDFIPTENDSLKSTDKSNNIEKSSFLPNDEFKGYFMIPLPQTNSLFSPNQFNPFGYTNPDDLQKHRNIQGYNRFGLLPILQQNSYPFLGRNFANNYPLMRSLLPLFEIENSSFDYARIQLLQEYYNGAQR